MPPNTSALHVIGLGLLVALTAGAACKSKSESRAPTDAAVATTPETTTTTMTPTGPVFFGYQIDMAKADVAARATRDGFAVGAGGIAGARLEGTLAGMRASSHWVFVDDRLDSMNVRFHPGGDKPPALRDTPVYRSLVASLGEPDADSTAHRAIWRRGDIQISIDQTGEQAKGQDTPVITHYEFAARTTRPPKPPTDEERQRREREREQKRREQPE